MKIHNILFLNLLFISSSLISCKQEPSYKLKEPFGAMTVSAIDDIEDEKQDYFKIPKKFLNKDKLKENERKNEVIKKKLKEARTFDPNAY